jgi:ribose transport system permease protein
MAAVEGLRSLPDRPGRALRRLGPTGSHVLALGCVVVVVVVGASLLSSTFLTSDNLLNVLRQISVLGILSAGTTLLMVSGGIDLSIGAVASWSGVLAAELLVKGDSPLLAVLVGVGLGMAIGALNGAAIVWSNAPPLILTLGALSIVEGFSLATTNAAVLPIEGFTWMGSAELLGLPVPALIAAVTLLAVGLLLRYSRLGRDAFAIGGNEHASYIAGIAIGPTKLVLYTISGGLAGVAGLVLLSRVGAASPTGGIGLELQAVAAVVIGGASLAGGRGSVLGTCMGVALLGVITNVLNLLNVQSYYQFVATGAVIAIAVIFGEVGSRWRTERGAGT